MLFLTYLAMVILTTHMLAPLGSLFIALLSQHNPYLFDGFSPSMRFTVELFLLYVPGAMVVLVFWIKTQLYDHLPPKNPVIQKIFLGGLGLFLVFAIGQNMENSLGNKLNAYIGVGMLLSRVLLLSGCIIMLLPSLKSSSGKEAPPPQNPEAGGKGGPSSDEEAALAALMGMMGGAGGGGLPGGGKAPPGHSKGGGFIKK